jgi:hypothetical protein
MGEEKGSKRFEKKEERQRRRRWVKDSLFHRTLRLRYV